MSLIEKNQINHNFTSFDTIKILSSLGIMVVVVVSILNHRVNQGKEEVALKEIQGLSQEILLGENSSSTKGRAPSSVEGGVQDPVMAKDPWGVPYQFHFVKNELGQPVYLVIWSAGPDSHFETHSENLALGGDGHIHVKFVGDDVGYVRSVR